jgi:hypothetical protein
MTTEDERDERIRRRAYEIREKDGKRDGDHNAASARHQLNRTPSEKSQYFFGVFTYY